MDSFDTAAAAIYEDVLRGDEESTDDGHFVVEAFVPAYLNRLRDDQHVDAEQVDVHQVTFDVGRHDPITQRLDESHVVLSASVQLSPS